METIRNAVMDIGEPRQLVLPCPYCGDNKVVMARQVKKEELESNPIFAEFLDFSGNNLSQTSRPKCSRLLLLYCRDSQPFGTCVQQIKTVPPNHRCISK
jgi:hypothetical protein